MSAREVPQQQRDAYAEWAHELRAGGTTAWHEIEAELVEQGRTPAERAVLEAHCRHLEEWHADWYRRDRAAAKSQEARETGMEGEWLPATATATACGAEAVPLPRLQDGAEDLGAVLRYLFRDLAREKPVWVFSGYHTLRAGETWEQVKKPGSLGRVEWRGAAVIIRGADGGTRVYAECRVRGVRKAGWNGYLADALHIERLSLRDESVRKLERALAEARKKVEANPQEGWRRRTALQSVTRLEGRLAQKRKDAGPALDVDTILSRLATLAVHYGFPDAGLRNNNDVAAVTGTTKQAVSLRRQTLTKEYVRQTDGKSGFAGQRSAARVRDAVKEQPGHTNQPSPPPL